jgi:hypothetical protein
MVQASGELPVGLSEFRQDAFNLIPLERVQAGRISTPLGFLCAPNLQPCPSNAHYGAAASPNIVIVPFFLQSI